MTYLEYIVREDPLAAVAFALVLGALIGATVLHLVTRQHRDSRGRFTKG